ncbi:hypothetical protein HJ526_04955 [Donghicola sp. C2-DW-16]|uniref:Peptide ABC transporter permease n=1 Tax=Donghicola mangrovi TaxID=2729614 RepID=A0ABX2PBA9_9RHOB|nr:hypothetical protein [Donghicola mangrovi]NVO26758.1 hypothetical protein [Donghicola mangrovi]
MNHFDRHSAPVRVAVARNQYGGSYQDFGRHYGYDRMEMMVIQRKITRRLYIGLAGLGAGAIVLAWVLGLAG